MKYDTIVVGAGPAGIFACLEILKLKPDARVLLLEKGRAIEKRICPKRKTGICAHCSPCNITSGFSGAGAYSDGKLMLSPDIGGILNEYMDEDVLVDLIDKIDKVYLSYGADKKVYGDGDREVVDRLKHQAIQSNLKFIKSRVRHIGTEKCHDIFLDIQKELVNSGIEIKFNTKVSDLIIRDGRICGVVADNEYLGDKVIITVGRDGAEWLKNICSKYVIQTKVGNVDIGVRVEVRNEVMKEVNEHIYESKLVYYTPTFDDKVRTFCHNPSGHVATEYYDDNLAVVNGHSYKSKKLKSKNTNFAILVTNYFTDPFKEPIEYGKYIARLGNLLSGNKIIVQRYGDFKRGRRTTEHRIIRNNIKRTLVDSIPGDLSLVLPYRIMLDIKEMIEALDNIFPGLASDETLLYGIEVKFYSNVITTSTNFETLIKGLYVGGDGAGITRGLIQASINGALLGRQVVQ